MDNEAEMRDITATLVDLAVKGYLTIEQIDEEHMLGLIHSKNYIFHLKKPPAEWAAARPHEQEMLSALFDGGANTDVKSERSAESFLHAPADNSRAHFQRVDDRWILFAPAGRDEDGFIWGPALGVGIATVLGASTLAVVMGFSQSPGL